MIFLDVKDYDHYICCGSIDMRLGSQTLAHVVLDQLKAAFQETDPKSLFRGLRQWLRMAFESGVQEVLSFAKTIRKRIRSLV